MDTINYSFFLDINWLVVFFLLIIGIILFQIQKWGLKKFLPNYRLRNIINWTLTLILTPLTFGLIIMIWLSIEFYYPTIEFTKDRWKSSPELRYELTDDLITKDILIGMTKHEILEILGDEGNSLMQKKWNYLIGFPPSFMSLESDLLVLEFEDEAVIKVYHKRR